MSSGSVLLEACTNNDKLLRFNCSVSTAPEVLGPTCDKFFLIHDLFKTNFKLLRFTPLSLDLRPINDKYCLKSGLLILGDFL